METYRYCRFCYKGFDPWLFSPCACETSYLFFKNRDKPDTLKEFLSKTETLAKRLPESESDTGSNPSS